VTAWPGPVVVDPLLAPDAAERVLGAWKAFPSYGLYSNEGFATQYAPELAQRYDAAVNFIRTGGRFGRRDEPMEVLLARTNYFRETYVYGDDVFAPDLAFLMRHEPLLDAARSLHGRQVIEPSILYANVMAPGQELAVHTDVPEFRGANRTVLPQWLVVVMHHSGLFEPWRMPIATGICYFGAGEGGELAYYPDGPSGPAAVYDTVHNTAAVLDTDSVFHGVDRVRGDESRLPGIAPGMRLHHDGNDGWSVQDGDEVVARYRADELRLSISWKAYCFADDSERDAWRTHADDLRLDEILDRLEADLRERGRLTDDRPADAEFGRLLIDEYIHFPAPTPAG
jgi:hypothetical protein